MKTMSQWHGFEVGLIDQWQWECFTNIVWCDKECLRLSVCQLLLSNSIATTSTRTFHAIQKVDFIKYI